VQLPGDNEGDDEEGSASPVREILLRNWSVGAYPSTEATGGPVGGGIGVGVGGGRDHDAVHDRGRLDVDVAGIVVMAINVDVALLFQKRTILAAMRSFHLVFWCGWTICAFFNS
jgi:hypothetical protein